MRASPHAAAEAFLNGALPADRVRLLAVALDNYAGIIRGASDDGEPSLEATAMASRVLASLSECPGGLRFDEIVTRLAAAFSAFAEATR